LNKNNLFFRFWYYFRIGWGTYFVFVLGAVNTLTVTYFLAVDNYPTLKQLFPSFEIYALYLTTILIPILIVVGYSHFKKTHAFKSEVDVIIESNPYQRRILVNTEATLSLNLKLINIIQKMAKDQNIDQEQLNELKKISEELSSYVNTRSFTNDDDLKFFKEKIKKED
tara:strand:+ start:1142 stop:1645 length:504 start_codon:yes stop_codon:yes gene_type:complete